MNSLIILVFAISAIHAQFCAIGLTCLNGGTCTGLACDCTNATASGSRCDQVPCGIFTCVNGATCISGTSCNCSTSSPSGFFGEECSNFMCDGGCRNGGFCYGPNLCLCQNGYTGPTCEQFECDPPCENGGTCESPNECACEGTGFGGAVCADLPASFRDESEDTSAALSIAEIVATVIVAVGLIVIGMYILFWMFVKFEKPQNK